MDIKSLTSNISTGRGSEQVRAQEERNSGKAAPQTASQTGSQIPADKVTLTGALTQLRELEQKTEAVNIDNSARIADLKAAIADGSYQVNAQNIAESLMKSESLLASI